MNEKLEAATWQLANARVHLDEAIEACVEAGGPLAENLAAAYEFFATKEACVRVAQHEASTGRLRP